MSRHKNLLILCCYLALSPVNARAEEPGILTETSTCLKNGDLSRAAELASQAIKQYPLMYDGYLLRAHARARLEDYPHALQDIDCVLRINPKVKNEYVHEIRYLCLYHLGRPGEAAVEMEREIAIKPKADKCKKLGELYRQLDEDDKAIDCFSKAIALDRKNYWSYINIGDIYKKRKDYTKALENYDKVVQIVPKEAVGYRLKANIYKILGQTDLFKLNEAKAKQRVDW